MYTPVYIALDKNTQKRRGESALSGKMETPLVLLFLVLISPLTLSQEYFEVTPPLPSDDLVPSCSLPMILQHSFINLTNTTTLFSTPYSPHSDCPAPWTYVVLELLAVCSKDTSYSISGLWLGGRELLRTSTPRLTTEKSPNSWKVRKDITGYSSLLVQQDINFTMFLGNVVRDAPAGDYNVSVTILFYKSQSFTVPLDNGSSELPISVEQEAIDVKVGGQNGARGIYGKPADLIIPISNDKGKDGFWFRIENELDMPSKQIVVPRNTYRAVLELYVSFHGNDESWYSNPPTAYHRMNKIASFKGNGAFREVFVAIDGDFAGSDLPFPVIYTGEINPLFWRPVVGIGAFDLPSYDFEVTPFLEKFLDGEVHEIGFGVGQGFPYWLVGGNLHLWLDKFSSTVEAGTLPTLRPSLKLRRREEFEGVDAKFEIQGKGKSESRGWVVSSSGKLTTVSFVQFRVDSLIILLQNGTQTSLKLRIRVHREVKVLNDRGEMVDSIIVRRQYPLDIVTSTLRGGIVANVSHSFNERSTSGNFWKAVYNRQESQGWMQMGAESSLPGDARTVQRLVYKGNSVCFSRKVTVNNGMLASDDLGHDCASVFSS